MLKRVFMLSLVALTGAANLYAQSSTNVFTEDIENEGSSSMSAIRRAFNRLPFKPSFVGPNSFCERDAFGNVTENCVAPSDNKSRVVNEAKIRVDAPTYKSAIDGVPQLNGDMNTVNNWLIRNSTTAGSLYITTSTLTDPAFKEGTVGSANIGALGFGNVLRAQDNYYDELAQSPGGGAIDGASLRGCILKETDNGIAPPLAAERCSGGRILNITLPNGGGSVNSVYTLADHPAHQLNQPAEVMAVRSLSRNTQPLSSMGLNDLNTFRELKLSEMVFGPHYKFGVELALPGGDRVARAHTAFVEIVGDRTYRSLDSDGVLTALNNSYSKRLTYKDVRTKSEDYWFIRFFTDAYHALNNALQKYCRIDKGEGIKGPHEYRPSYSTCADGNFEACDEFKKAQTLLLVNGFSLDRALIAALYRAERDRNDERDPSSCDQLFRTNTGDTEGNFYFLFNRIYGLRNQNMDDNKDISDRERAVFEIAFKTGVAKVIEVLMDARNEILKMTGNRANQYAKEEALGKIDSYVGNLQEAFAEVQQSMNEDIMNILERDTRDTMQSSDSFKGRNKEPGGISSMGGGFGDT